MTPTSDRVGRARRVIGRLVVTAVALAGLVGAAFLWVRSHGFSARATPGSFEASAARFVRSIALPREVRARKNPLEPTEIRLAKARDHFADHCATCHANDGSGKTMINGGLYPPAGDLRGPEVQSLSDGELFHVIREGVRYTGMPGWGGDDTANWELVLFVRHLPALSPAELSLMREVNQERY